MCDRGDFMQIAQSQAEANAKKAAKPIISKTSKANRAVKKQPQKAGLAKYAKSLRFIGG